MHQLPEILIEKCFGKCKEIRLERTKEYESSEIGLLTYFPEWHRYRGILRLKLIRLFALAEKTCPLQDIAAKIQDTLVDIINYASFAHATVEHHLKQIAAEEEEKKKDNDQSPCK